jgi:DNA-binding MarR family transcriptional regulator
MTSHPTSYDHEFATPVEPVGYLLMRVHRALRAMIDDTLRPHGFTMPQVAVMFALGRKSGLSTADLARLAFVTPQAMGEVLAGLEAKGFVVRRAHDSHGRIQPAELTATGVEARNLCHDVLERAEKQMLSDLSSDERRMLGSTLERCLVGLDDPSAEPAARDGSIRLRARPLKVQAEP